MADRKVKFQREARRPLFAGGEQLREKVEPGSGGGPKWHPRTMDEAVELLSPQLEQLREKVTTTPASLRGARVVFEAKVSPNYLANSYFPSTLFREADLVPVGTRGSIGEYKTPKKTEECETKTYLLAAGERALGKVSALLHGNFPSAPTLNRARDSLRQFELVRLPSAEDTLKGEMEETADLVTWEVVFHPLFDLRGEPSTGEWQAVFGKWETLINSLGGRVERDFIRTIKGMTFMPIRLAQHLAPKAAQFNPLRTMRPMPGIRPVPISPLRIQTTEDDLPNPPAAERPQSDLRVAVFDGGVDGSISHLAPFVRSFDLTSQTVDTS